MERAPVESGLLRGSGWILAVALVLSAWPLAAQSQSEVREEMLWDTWGVPHIYARTREAACERLGWAQMRAHANLIASIYGAARGRSAAHVGARAFEDDALVHVLRIPERAEAWLAAQSPEARRCIEGFTRGLNAFVTAHPEQIAAAQRWVLPLVPTDVLAQLQHLLFVRFMFSDQHAIQAFRTGRKVRVAPAVADVPGSNAYAVAPSRSASREPMLVINPHLPWSGELLLFEAQVVLNGRSFYGAGLVGQPYLSMGFSADGGWTHTVNSFDGLDTYVLTLRGDGYLFDGEVRPFERTEPAVLEVQDAKGKIRTRTVPRLASVHGPVVWLDKKAGKALALRFTGLEASDVVEHYWSLAAARTVQQFEVASNRHRLPYFNTVYASRDGDILYRFEALLPKRSRGDSASWQGLQDGTTSTNLWTASYGVEALPRVLNPASGFVQNANDPPWYASYPQTLDPAAYPAYLEPPRLHLRAQQSIRMLDADPSVSFDELVAYKQSNRVELAERVLPALLEIGAGQPALRDACRILAAWDRTLSPDARGAVLFLAWVTAMGGPDGGWYAEPWSAAAPLATPRGIARPEQARRALTRAINVVKRRHGRLDVPYGDAYRLRRGSYDLPASTGPSEYGLYSAAGFLPSSDGRQVAWGGDTFVAVVAWGAQPRAQGLLTYGNATQPGSPHVGDQLPLFSERRLRPLWLTRAEVEQHLELRE